MGKIYGIGSDPIKRFLRKENLIRSKIFEQIKIKFSEGEIIANIKNLEFIPWIDNMKKKDRCSIELNQLLKEIGGNL